MAHTLTFSDVTVIVNGSSVTSPYTLQNGDVIRVETQRNYFWVNDVEYSDSNFSDSPISISDTDIIIIGNTTGTPYIGGGEYNYIIINYTETAPIIFFKRFFRNSPIGSGTIRFRPYTVAEPLPQLATVSNVSVEGTTVSWDEVENATSYEVRADGESIGTAYNSTLVFASYDWSSDYYVQYSIDGGNTFTSISVPTSEESTMEFDLGLISTIIFKVKIDGGFTISTQEGYEIINTYDDIEKISEEFILSNKTIFNIMRNYD